MAVVTITESELLAALAAAAPGANVEGAKTVRELMDETGMTIRAVRRSLANLKHDNRLVVHNVLREGLDGRACRVAAYTITPAPKKRAA